MTKDTERLIAKVILDGLSASDAEGVIHCDDIKSVRLDGWFDLEEVAQCVAQAISATDAP